MLLLEMVQSHLLLSFDCDLGLSGNELMPDVGKILSLFEDKFYTKSTHHRIWQI